MPAMTWGLAIRNVTNSSSVSTSVTVDYTRYALSDEICRWYAYNFTKEMAYYSAHAYCPRYDRLKGENVPIGEACDSVFCQSLQDVQLLKVYSEQITYYITQDRHFKRIIVSFKGTSTTDEWKFDTNYRLRHYNPLVVQDGYNVKQFTCPGCKVHRGFLNGYKIFYRESMRYLLDFKSKHPDYQLYLVGHSLGGAIAQLAGIEAYLCGMDPIIVNYGSPKLTNYALACWMQAQFPLANAYQSLQTGNIHPNSYFRVTHDMDIVPLLPLYTQGFAHTGYEIVIENFNLPVPVGDLSLMGDFDESGEYALWQIRLRKAWNNYREYFKDPMSGYQDFVQTDYHRYYYTRMTCSYKRQP